MWKLRSMSWLGFRITPKVKNLEYLRVMARKRGEVTRFSGRKKVEREYQFHDGRKKVERISVSWWFCFLFSLTQYFKAEPRGYLTKFYAGGGGVRPEVQPVPLKYPLIYHFWQKRYFRIPSINHVLILCCHGFINGTPFAYLIWNFAFLVWLSCINSSHIYNQNVFSTISQP